MKARLYRGPFNGKVVHVRPGDPAIEMVRQKKLSRREKIVEWNFNANLQGTYGSPLVPMVRARYIPMRYTQPDGRYAYSMHPDGSVFYEWDQLRRTR